MSSIIFNFIITRYQHDTVISRTWSSEFIITKAWSLWIYYHWNLKFLDLLPEPEVLNLLLLEPEASRLLFINTRTCSSEFTFPYFIFTQFTFSYFIYFYVIYFLTFIYLYAVMRLARPTYQNLQFWIYLLCTLFIYLSVIYEIV